MESFIQLSSLKWIASSSPMVRVGFMPTAESSCKHGSSVDTNSASVYGALEEAHTASMWFPSLPAVTCSVSGSPEEYTLT